ncbi:hypothetical protein T440DRAFT_522649 [Plenodomus tracheiphilus IPT5]|uniref:Uncharacterized protein n=1 Tax=Plenodomus tracheiphilus IPT5 TaxID=1408161 RepID=A0A6A7ATH2_9PLEO|nr:hypothetical protein T440DRAFT_522649 [Plenodomus tracheiphilus IPT5]
MAPIPTACPISLPSIISVTDLDTSGWSKQTILALVGVLIVPATPCAALLLRLLYSKLKIWKGEDETNADEENIVDPTKDDVETHATPIPDLNEILSVSMVATCDSAVGLEEHSTRC